jgi:hypothetical protein
VSAPFFSILQQSDNSKEEENFDKNKIKLTRKLAVLKKGQ